MVLFAAGYNEAFITKDEEEDEFNARYLGNNTLRNKAVEEGEADNDCCDDDDVGGGEIISPHKEIMPIPVMLSKTANILLDSSLSFSMRIARQ